METPVEQTLSKPTIQFGLRLADYLVLILIATVGNFFIPKFWLLLVLVIMAAVFNSVNKRKPRFFWSSLYLWLTTNSNLQLEQTRPLPPLFREDEGKRRKSPAGASGRHGM